MCVNNGGRSHLHISIRACTAVSLARKHRRAKRASLCSLTLDMVQSDSYTYVFARRYKNMLKCDVKGIFIHCAEMNGERIFVQ